MKVIDNQVHSPAQKRLGLSLPKDITEQQKLTPAQCLENHQEWDSDGRELFQAGDRDGCHRFVVGSGRRVQNGQRLVKLRQGRRNSLPSNCLVAYNEYVKTFVSLCQRLVSGNYKHFFPTCVNVRQDVWKITGDTGLFFFV